jgi:putative DNA primase/helicase
MNLSVKNAIRSPSILAQRHEFQNNSYCDNARFEYRTYELLPDYIPLIADAFAPFDVDANFIYDRATFDGQAIKFPKHAIDPSYYGNTALFSHRHTDNHGNTFFLINLHSEKTGETISFNTKTAYFQLRDKNTYTPKIDHAAVKQRAEKAKQLAQQEQQKVDYLQHQFELWLQQLNATPTDALVNTHPYLLEKFGKYAPLASSKITNLQRTQDERGDCLIIGLVQEIGGNVCCIQKIYDRNISKQSDRTRNKDFRGTKKGAFHVIGNLKHAHKGLYFVEGYATGLTVHLATGLPVIVCLDAGNLPIVVKKFSDWGYKNLSLCPDNDIKENKPNVGLIAAFNAVKEVPLASLFVPHNDGNKCDFNDILLANGLDDVKRQLHKDNALSFENGKLYVNKRKNKSGLERAEYERAFEAFMIQVLPEQKETRRTNIINSLLENCPRYYSLETTCFKAEQILIYERDKDALHAEIKQAYQHKKDTVKRRHSLTKADLQGVITLDLANTYDVAKLHTIARFDRATILDNRGMGSGKTENNNDIISKDLDGLSSFQVVPRVSLSYNISNTFKTAHYKSVGRDKYTAQVLTSCVNSMPQFKPEKEFQHAFFDEMRLILESVLDGATMKNNLEVFNCMSEFIKHSRLSVFSDADLNSLTLDYIRNAAPDKPIYLIVDSRPRKYALPTVIYRGSSLDNLRHEIVDRIKKGEKLYIVCDSVAEVVKTKLFLKSKGIQDGRILDIHAGIGSTKGNALQQAFLDNPNIESLNYDAVIVSPVIQVGFSICNGYFDATIGLLGSGTCTSNEIAQSLYRVRDAKEIVIAIAAQRNRNRAVSLNLFLDGEVNTQHQINDNGDLIVKLDELSQRNYRALVQRNEDLNDLENSILLHLENIGFDVIHAIPETVQKIVGLSEDVKVEQAKAIKEAPSITSSGFAALSENKQHFTTEQSYIYERHLVEDMVGATAHTDTQLEQLNQQNNEVVRGITDDDITNYQDGMLARILNRELMLVDIEELKKIDQENHGRGKRQRRKTVSRWLIDSLLDALDRHSTTKSLTNRKTAAISFSEHAFDKHIAAQICDEVLTQNAAMLVANGYADYTKPIERPVQTLRNIFNHYGYNINWIGRDTNGDRLRWFEIVEDDLVTKHCLARAINRSNKLVQ